MLENVEPGVFDKPVEPELRSQFLADSRHHLVVALDDQKVVGFASAVDYVHPDKPVELWINEVSVAPAYRRKGIGRRLLDALLGHGRKLGCRDAWLATEADNEPARRLHAAVGGRDEPIVMYSFSLSDDSKG